MVLQLQAWSTPGLARPHSWPASWFLCSGLALAHPSGCSCGRVFADVIKLRMRSLWTQVGPERRKREIGDTHREGQWPWKMEAERG